MQNGHHYCSTMAVLRPLVFHDASATMFIVRYQKCAIALQKLGNKNHESVKHDCTNMLP